MSEETQQLIREGYAALSRRDVEAWLELIAEDAELHELSEIPDSAVYRGRDEIRAWAEAAIQLVDEWDWIPEAFILDQNDMLVVRARLQIQGRGSGVPLEQIIFHLMRFRGQELVSISAYLQEAQALEAVPQTG